MGAKYLKYSISISGFLTCFILVLLPWTQTTGSNTAQLSHTQIGPI